MLKEEWLKDIKPNNLPETCKEFLECMNLDSFIKFLKYFGGTSIYIPKIDCLLRCAREQKIVQDCKEGLSYKEIGRKYGISERWVAETISQNKRRKEKC